jgi:hypothetical protein
MNAEELAVNLDAASGDMEYNYVVSDWKLLSDAATMLRQQQAEIEALKDALRMKVILNEHVAQSMKETKELLK